MAALNVAVLISGRGSNAAAMIHASCQLDSPFRIVGIIADRPSAPGLSLPRALDIPTHVADYSTFATPALFEDNLEQTFRAWNTQLVVLAGFMRILSPTFTERWRDRFVNIHPTLLPAFPGLHGVRQALAAGVRIAGCTVHFVRPDVDSGPIIAQGAVAVAQDDTEESLAARILEVECRLYPRVVRLIAEGRVSIHNDRVLIAGTLAPQGALLNPEEQSL